MDGDDGLEIKWDPPNRNGVFRVRIRRNGELLHADEVCISRQSARRTFIRNACGKIHALKPEDLEAKLLRILDQQERAARKAQPSEPIEIEVSRIVRPERFISSDVSGLTVATVTMDAGKPVGRWAMYLRWSDGTRKCMDLCESLDLADGSRLWIQPQPGEPEGAREPQWSARSRKAWQAGEAAPDAAELLRRIFERIAYYLDLPTEYAKGIAGTLGLWTVFTYVHAAWDSVPYLYFGGPAGSGKSRTFEVLRRMVFRPLSSSSMTGPALFRTLHNLGGTLLMDEAERLRSTSPEVGELLSMLLAGYQRGGRATRLEGDSTEYRTREFDVFGPKALACIAGLPPALMSRCIPVTMFRAGPGSVKPRRRLDEDPAKWSGIRDELHILCLEHGPAWLELSRRDDVCPEMTGRHYELWQPLLALASWFEEQGAGGLLNLMQEHALLTIESVRDDETPDVDVLLLRTLAGLALEGYEPTPTEVLSRAREEEADSFIRWTMRPRGG